MKDVNPPRRLSLGSRRVFEHAGRELGEESGKVTGNRVLSVDAPGPKVETSVQDTGKLLGHEVTTWITHTSVPKEPNLLEGEGHGVIMTAKGDMATFTGHGVGHLTGKGAGVGFRGSLNYKAESNELAKLNEVVGVFEFEV